jgi:hypothetical protein
LFRASSITSAEEGPFCGIPPSRDEVLGRVGTRPGGTANFDGFSARDDPAAELAAASPWTRRTSRTVDNPEG